MPGLGGVPGNNAHGRPAQALLQQFPNLAPALQAQTLAMVQQFQLAQQQAARRRRRRPCAASTAASRAGSTGESAPSPCCAWAALALRRALGIGRAHCSGRARQPPQGQGSRRQADAHVAHPPILALTR